MRRGEHRAGRVAAPPPPPPAGPLYREHVPHPALARHVACYWSIRAEIDRTAPVAGRVLPDGCMDIIVSVPGPASGTSDPPPQAIGTMTRPLAVTYSGRVDLFSVRFRPGAARPFLEADASELTDAALPLDELWGGLAQELQERLAAAPPRAHERAAILDRFLLARLDRGPAADARVLAAIDSMVRRHGRATVEEMAEAAGVSARQLERRFLAAVGVSPSTARRVERFRRAVSLLRERPDATLSRVAFSAGYADQPHLTREFRALSGATPAAFRGALDEHPAPGA